MSLDLSLRICFQSRWELFSGNIYVYRHNSLSHDSPIFRCQHLSQNLWGFKRIKGNKGGTERGAYHHSYFVRGKPDLCYLMTRQKVKGRTIVIKSEPNDELHHQAMLQPQTSVSSACTKINSCTKTSTASPSSSALNIQCGPASASTRFPTLPRWSFAEFGSIGLLQTRKEKASDGPKITCHASSSSANSSSTSSHPSGESHANEADCEGATTKGALIFGSPSCLTRSLLEKIIQVDEARRALRVEQEKTATAIAAISLLKHPRLDTWLGLGRTACGFIPSKFA